MIYPISNDLLEITQNCGKNLDEIRDTINLKYPRLRSVFKVISSGINPKELKRYQTSPFLRKIWRKALVFALNFKYFEHFSLFCTHTHLGDIGCCEICISSVWGFQKYKTTECKIENDYLFLKSSNAYYTNYTQ